MSHISCHRMKKIILVLPLLLLLAFFLVVCGRHRPNDHASFYWSVINKLRIFCSRLIRRSKMLIMQTTPVISKTPTSFRNEICVEGWLFDRL